MQSPAKAVALHHGVTIRGKPIVDIVVLIVPDLSASLSAWDESAPGCNPDNVSNTLAVANTGKSPPIH